MAEIRSFRAIRPRKELTARIAALPYDVYNSKEARKEVEREPLSFLKIDRAETQLGEEVDLYSQEVYEKARETLLSMEQEGCSRRRRSPAFICMKRPWTVMCRPGWYAARPLTIT